MREDEEKLLNIIESVQDFGVCGRQGDLVDNKKLARVLSEHGCIVVKTIDNKRNKKQKEATK